MDDETTAPETEAAVPSEDADGQPDPIEDEDVPMQVAPRPPIAEAGPTNAERREWDPFAPHDAEPMQKADQAAVTEAGPVNRDEDAEPEPDDEPEKIEAPVGDGEWKAQGALNVDGVFHKLWVTAEGKVAVLIGDLETGSHLIADDTATLAAEVRAVIAQLTHASE